MGRPLKLCDTCQHVKLEEYLYLADYPGTMRLGPFQDIAKKDHCPLCRLVIQAFNSRSQQHWKAGIYPVEVCYLGRYDETSNRPGLEVWFNSTSETLPEGISGHSTTLAQILPLHQPLVRNESKAGAISCAQRIDEKVDISRIRSWMENCASLHGQKCSTAEPAIQKAGVSLLLVDVRRMRLAKCDWESRYIALSYVWGSSAGLKSTKANLHRLQKDGALRELRGELPQAVTDAIDFTDALGEVYLWVDALCIVQDDNSSKNVYISRMGQIYRGAHVTLVTLNDPSANSALPGVALSRVLIQSPVEINGLHLVPRLPQLFIVEQDSTWSSRAWTFQEGILSRRCLYFAEHQVFWQCRTTYQSEDCIHDHDQDASEPARGGTYNALEQETGNDTGLQFKVYESLVKQYSPKALTFPADSLFAFAGVLSAIADSFSWKFASALPESAFDLALLWRPMFSATMRPRALPGQKAQPLVCTSPTWCWTAWRGDLYWDAWHLDCFASQTITIKTEVPSFWIRDSKGLRQIRRQQDFDSHVKISGYTASTQTKTDCALVFEAKLINVKAYNISIPQIDQCSLWNSKIAGGGLSHYFRNRMGRSLWIYDAAGHHCGTLPGFGIDAWPMPAKNRPRHYLVLLSRSSQDEVTQSAIQHSQDHLPLEYPSEREYYEEIFDARHYKYKNDWALNVMLVRWEKGLAERVAVGQLHADAWNEAFQESRLITLA